MTTERSGREWRPVLEGAEAERALETVRDIVEAVPAPGAIDGGDPALAGGDAGVALLHAWAARAGAGGDEERAVPYLEAAIDALATMPLPTALYGGFTGVAWSAELLQGGGGDEEEDLNAEIDEALLSHVEQTPWTTHYDLISGPVGIGVYALERLPRRSGAALVEEIVARLDETAVRLPEGIAWHTAWDLLPEYQRPTYTRGHYNLGVAHGVPGVVSLLGQVVASGVAADRARALLEGAVEWVLAQELPADAPSRFGYSVAEGVGPGHSRAAWCYGDPGIAAALLVAARGAGEEAWEREALRIARDAARRPEESCGVVDAGICHGAAGLALVYGRIFAATGDEELAEASRFWARRTLEMRNPGEGVAGYRSWGPPRGGGPSRWLDDAGLLTGASGVALALLAAATPVEPEWDRFLLVSSRFC